MMILKKYAGWWAQLAHSDIRDNIFRFDGVYNVRKHEQFMWNNYIIKLNQSYN